MLVALFAGVLSGCIQASSPSPQRHTADRPSRMPSPSAAASSAVRMPSDPEPVASGPCPYLETAWVERTNGQRVSKVRVADDDPPACFFYSLNGKQQLMVNVYTGDPAVATEVVNDAARIERSNPATRPSGWKGGYMSTEDGAVYAVARSGSAVVVTTNQKQSVKAREVVERTIDSLGL